MTKAQKREELEKAGLPNNKRNRKNLEKEREAVILEENAKSNARGIKHFSAVQNKPIYYQDISQYENKIMMNVDVPLFWYLNPK